MDQLRPQLDNVLKCLSSNGYSVFSLINDILTRSNSEDERIKILREGLERDAADICARLQALSHTSGPESILEFGGVQFKDHRHAVPIDILPDNVFLEIFNFRINDRFELGRRRTKRWQTLAHVCQRWRGIIFASPRRLDLHLECLHRTPVQKNLVFWPVNLPLILDYNGFHGPVSPEDEDNIDAAFEQPGRVRQITISAKAPLIEKVVAALQKSFPALSNLDLTCADTVFPVIFGGFLDGPNIPHLETLRLSRIPLPQLPAPFSSACNLVTLHLAEMPANGYVSPDAMVRSIAALTRLKHLSISFYQRMSLSDEWRSPPDHQARVILPTLTILDYEGRSEYLEDLLARIDIPRVEIVTIEYVMHQIQASQLSRFMERKENLSFKRAYLYFYLGHFSLGLDRSDEESSERHLTLRARVQDMSHLLGQLAAMLSKVHNLIASGDSVAEGGTDITDEWLPLFHLFPGVEKLRLSGTVALDIASALEDINEKVTNVFPMLYLIQMVEGGSEVIDEYECHWIEQVGPMERFIWLRQLSGFPVTVVTPDNEVEQKVVGASPVVGTP